MRYGEWGTQSTEKRPLFASWPTGTALSKRIFATLIAAAAI
jgi:hypothetical protein